MRLILDVKTTAIALFATFEIVGANAQTLMLDFGQTNVASPYLTVSPGHNSGVIGLSDTSWNVISSSAVNNALVYANGSAATGITLSLGQEATGGNNIISYSTPIASLNLAGTGGSVPGQQSLLGVGSIYGDNNSSTAVGRDGFFGSGSATTTGTAIGLRLDGMAAGNYVLYVMARNANTDATSVPMSIFASAGAAAGTFDFSSLTASLQSNVGYASATYAGEYNSFVDGGNYVAISVSIGVGDSLFVAVDGATGTVERRGFLNSFQIAPAPVPEPASMALAGLGLAGLMIFRRRR